MRCIYNFDEQCSSGIGTISARFAPIGLSKELGRLLAVIVTERGGT
jgi:hypothetical protein